MNSTILSALVFPNQLSTQLAAKLAKYPVSIPEFSAVLPPFSAKSTKFFREHSNVLKIFEVIPDLKVLTSGGELCYPINVSIFFYASEIWRLELRKAAKTCLPGALKFIPNFSAKFYHIFPQNIWQQGKVGKLTCHFLAEVEG
jgi:hypothetical protein